MARTRGVFPRVRGSPVRVPALCSTRRKEPAVLYDEAVQLLVVALVVGLGVGLLAALTTVR